MELVAISSWCWHAAYHAGRFSLLEAPRAAARLGFRFIELNDFMLPPPRFSRLRRPLLELLDAPPALWRYDPSTLRRLQRELTATHATCFGWTLDTDLTVSGRRWLWQRLYLEAGARTAGRLRASLLRVTVGGAVDLLPRVDSTVARRLAQLAQRHRFLIIAVENHGDLSADVERFCGIMRAARGLLPPAEAARLGVCFDPGNVLPKAREQQWALLAPLAVHVHFKTRAFTSIGEEASLPYPLILKLLSRAGYSGGITIEYEGNDEPEHGIRRSLALLKRHHG